MQINPLPILVGAALLFAGCGDDKPASTCDRYREYAEVMTHVDPEYWSVPQRCPSDQQIEGKGWPQKTLAECVAYLETQCEMADVDVCRSEGTKCLCSVGLGAQRTVCAPF